MKKKILFIVNSMGQGGVERTLIEVLKILPQSDFEISLFLRNNVTELLPLVPHHVRVIIDEDGKYFREPRAVIYKLRRDEKGLSEYIHKRKVCHPAETYFKDEVFDAVISYTVSIISEMALEIKAKRHIVFYHSGKIDFYGEGTPGLLRRFDNIVACGPGVELMLRENLGDCTEKISCLTNYIDFPRIKKGAAESVPEIEEQKKSGDFIICTTCRFAPQKALPVSVRAAAKLRENGVNFHWYLVGDGDLRGSIEELIASLGLSENFTVTGFTDNPFKYVAASDLYVQSSVDEAQPLAITEALMLGKAVVSTGTTGGKAVLEYGKRGIITGFSDKDVADGIMRLYNDEKLRRSFEKPFTDDDDARAKREYEEKWLRLLS